MSRLSLALCGLVLAALPSTSALADTLTFDFSFTSSGIDGSGTFTASSDGVDQYLITSVTGTTNTGDGTNRPITSLFAPNTFPDPSLGANDNLLVYSPSSNTWSLDEFGVSWELRNGADVNLFEAGDNGGVLLQRTNGNQVLQLADITVTPEASPVPEPGSLALFGTGVLGMVGVIRRKLAV